MLRNILLLISLVIVGVLAGIWVFDSIGSESLGAALPASGVSPEQEESTQREQVEAPVTSTRSASIPATESAPTTALEEPEADDVQPISSYWCRLVAADDGGPAADAIVAFGGQRDLLSGRPGGSSTQTRSDANGLVELPYFSEQQTSVRVDATGFGPIVFRTAPGHESPEDAQDLTLQRAAALVVRITDAGGVPVEGARVDLSTPSYAIARPEGSYLFGGDPHWSAVTDVNGFCQIEQLPPEAPLAVSARGSAGQLHKEPNDLVLEPGERRELEWSIGSGTNLRGRLLDQHDSPVMGRELWLSHRGLNHRPERQRFYFYSGDDDEIVDRTRTDERGHFVFEDVVPGIWFVGPSPYPQRRGESGPDSNSISPVATAVEVLAVGATPEMELRLTRGLFIRGQVTHPGNEPPRHVRVSSSSDLGSLSAQVNNLDFVLGPVEPVVHTMRASFAGEFADSERVEVKAGEQDVLLHLKEGGQFSGYFIDGRTGQRCSASVMVSCQPNSHYSMGGDAGPEFSRKGLNPGAYDLSASAPDGLFGILRGVEVEAGASVDDLEIRLEAGAKLRVRYTGSLISAQYTVFHEGSVVALNGLLSGTTELETIPAGRIMVRMKFRNKQVEEREVTCAAGTETEVAFELE